MRIVLLEALMEQHVRDSLERALLARGHEVIAARPRWRGQRFPETSAERALMDGVLDELIALRPDLLLNFRASALTPAMVDRLRAARVTAAVWFSDDPVLWNLNYRHVVERYDLVLNCGGPDVLAFYEARHGVRGVNFPFFTDATACPRLYGRAPFEADIVFMGNSFGAVRRWRYGLVERLPGRRVIYGQLDEDPAGLSGGRISDHAVLMERVARARIGFSVPQLFSHYRGTASDFPGLARLGSFEVPSRIVQYAALGSPILSLGGRRRSDAFPEAVQAGDPEDLAGAAEALLADDERRAAIADACHERFLADFTADRRAAFLEHLVADPGRLGAEDADVRATLYRRFDDPAAPRSRGESAPPIAALREQAATLVVDSPRKWRMLAIGAALNGPTDVVACLFRAAESVGHSVLRLDPFRRREFLRNVRVVPGGFGGNMLDAERIAALCSRAGIQMVVVAGGGLGFDEAGAEPLKAAGLALLGITLSDPDVQASVIEAAGRFDLHFTNAFEALAGYAAAGLRNTRHLPFAVDRAWVAAEVAPDPEFDADVICLGNATGRPDRVQAMTALRSRFDARPYGRGWPFPEARSVSGADLLGASRGGLLHVNFPRTLAGHTNVKCGVFESVGSGAVLLTERFPEMAALFDYGEEIVGYAGVEDLLWQVERLLAFPEDRRRIAAQGLARLLREHLYEHRWLRIAAELEAALTDPAGHLADDRRKGLAPLLATAGRRALTVLVLEGDDWSSLGVLERVEEQVRRLRPEVQLVVLGEDAATAATPWWEQVDPGRPEAVLAAVARADAVLRFGGSTASLDSLSGPHWSTEARARLQRLTADLPVQDVDPGDQDALASRLAALAPRPPTPQRVAQLFGAADGPRRPAAGPAFDGAPGSLPFRCESPLTRVADLQALGEPDRLLSEEPVTLTIHGGPGERATLWLARRIVEDEAPTAAVVQFEFEGDDDSPRNAYGHLGRRLGRHRYLPLRSSGERVRLDLIMPASGRLTLRLRAWNNIGPVFVSDRYALFAA